MKFIKRLFVGLLIVILLAIVGAAAFVYKAKQGINFYETAPHNLPDDLGDEAILLFAKTNGFRHGAAIDAASAVIGAIADRRSWPLYETSDAGVFNPEQLAKFSVVIWNNVTGKALTTAQRAIFKTYILEGGTFIGIHGAGDNSHQWDWYEQELIGAQFSHHPLNPQLQRGTLIKDSLSGAPFISLSQILETSDEWYVFDAPPSEAFQVIYRLDEANLEMSGNLSFLVKDKDFGMGDDHPIAWYRSIGNGKAFYSALGHNKAAFGVVEHQQLLEAAVEWGME